MRIFTEPGRFSGVSTKAQAILDEIRALPPQELDVVWRELQHLVNTMPRPVAADPIRSARGMFAGSRLNDALLASRAEERRWFTRIQNSTR